MTADDIRKLADDMTVQRSHGVRRDDTVTAVLRALVDVVEAAQTLLKPGKPLHWAPLQQALARVDAL